MGGLALFVLLFAITFLWSGGRMFLVAFRFARHGLLNVPALTIGGLELWGGGLLALAAGTLSLSPPSIPGSAEMIGWTIVVFTAVLAIVVLRRPEIEERLPQRTRQMLDGRYVALGAALTAAALYALRYL